MKASPQRILVRAPNWIGDQILTYPFFHYLRQSHPHAWIAVACVPWVESIQFKNIINEVILLPKSINSTLGARWDAVETGAEILRKKGPWDLAITLPNSFSSGWLLFRSKAKVRRGYSTDGRTLLLNSRVEWKEEMAPHRAQTYLDLLPSYVETQGDIQAFWGELPENELDPPIPGVLDRFEPEKAWPDVEPLRPPTGPYWVLAPGAAAESRKWPLDRFASLARQIADTTGWTGVIVGGPSEAPLAMNLIGDRSLKLLDWTARGPVSSLWKVFQGAKFSVCNDSGLAHVAALCGSPVQIIWGAGDPKHTEPLGPGKVRVIFNPAECWPCEKNQCNLGDERKLQCLRGIHPEAVWKEIQSGIQPK